MPPVFLRQLILDYITCLASVIGYGRCGSYSLSAECESWFGADVLIFILLRAALQIESSSVCRSESEMYLIDPYKYVQTKLKRNDFGSEDS